MSAPHSPWSVRDAMQAHVPGNWTQQAICAETDPEIFFPEKGASSARAKAICAQCPVRVDCARYALHSPAPVFGVWGGLNAMERRDIRRTNGIKDVVDEEHGTEAAAKRHERRGEVPCFACRQAAAGARRRRGW